MADVKFNDEDYQAILGVNKNGMTIRTPRDEAMRQVNQAQSVLMGTMSSMSQGTENAVATDAMRARGLNTGFDAPPSPGNKAVEKMKNGLARNSGKTKNQLFGGQ